MVLQWPPMWSHVAGLSAWLSHGECLRFVPQQLIVASQRLQPRRYIYTFHHALCNLLLEVHADIYLQTGRFQSDMILEVFATHLHWSKHTNATLVSTQVGALGLCAAAVSFHLHDHQTRC